MATTASETRLWNVPNTLTMGRLFLAVVVLALISAGWYFSALVSFAIASSTDALDGYLARRLNQVTALGRQLDPLVDKIIVLGAFIFLLTVPGTGLAPWMVTVVVLRELVIQALRSHLEGQGMAFGARWPGKVKTTFQCLAISAILACLWLDMPQPWLMGRDALVWISIALTLYSGLDYLSGAMSLLRGDAAPLR
jgi:CDP-diacylglycerol--glycerol-3-phosphate 3-phosphatidyltransferase